MKISINIKTKLNTIQASFTDSDIFVENVTSQIFANVAKNWLPYKYKYFLSTFPIDTLSNDFKIKCFAAYAILWLGHGNTEIAHFLNTASPQDFLQNISYDIYDDTGGYLDSFPYIFNAVVPREYCWCRGRTPIVCKKYTAAGTHFVTRIFSGIFPEYSTKLPGNRIVYKTPIRFGDCLLDLIFYSGKLSIVAIFQQDNVIRSGSYVIALELPLTQYDSFTSSTLPYYLLVDPQMQAELGIGRVSQMQNQAHQALGIGHVSFQY